MTELSHKDRKERPVLTGVLDYFPDAIFEVAHCSFVCNEQHNPGEPMYWAKDKSIGEGNEIVRHLMDRKKHTRDTDGVRVLAKAAWRALELLQREIDAEKAEEEALKLTKEIDAERAVKFGPEAALEYGDFRNGINPDGSPAFTIIPPRQDSGC